MDIKDRKYLVEYIERYKEVGMESLYKLSDIDLRRIYHLVAECKALRIRLKNKDKE